MKKLLLLSVLLVFSVLQINAQKKSELITQNQDLKYRLDSVSRIVSSAKQNEKIGLLKAEELQKQVTELQDANATLMKNLNSFATLSSQNSENINKTLATLERKEAQIKGIVDAIASNDSTALVILTNAKQTLGENANVQVSGGSIIISEKLDFFFPDGLGTALNENAKIWLEKVAKIANSNPKSIITVAGLNITGELELALGQASSVAEVLIKDFMVSGDRVSAKGMDGGLRESLQIIFEPDYKSFYTTAKGEVKN